MLDYGARNIDNYAYLNAHMAGLKYYYRDLPQNNEVIKNLKNKNSINNLVVVNEDTDIKNLQIDFVFMGSVLQYLKNYKEVLKSIFYSNPEYILL